MPFFCRSYCYLCGCYGKELFQILCMASGDPPEQGTFDLEGNQGIMAQKQRQ